MATVICSYRTYITICNSFLSVLKPQRNFVRWYKYIACDLVLSLPLADSPCTKIHQQCLASAMIICHQMFCQWQKMLIQTCWWHPFHTLTSLLAWTFLGLPVAQHVSWALIVDCVLCITWYRQISVYRTLLIRHLVYIELKSKSQQLTMSKYNN